MSPTIGCQYFSGRLFCPRSTFDKNTWDTSKCVAKSRKLSPAPCLRLRKYRPKLLLSSVIMSPWCCSCRVQACDSATFSHNRYPNDGFHYKYLKRKCKHWYPKRVTTTQSQTVTPESLVQIPRICQRILNRTPPHIH